MDNMNTTFSYSSLHFQRSTINLWVTSTVLSAYLRQVKAFQDTHNARHFRIKKHEKPHSSDAVVNSTNRFWLCYQPDNEIKLYVNPAIAFQFSRMTLVR